MNKYALIFAFLLTSIGVSAQNTDSLMNALNAGDKKNEPVIAAFKATRLIFSQTTETVKKNNLNFLILHRFGDIGTAQGGAQTDFGLDRVQDVYIGFEYGLSDNFNLDFGRSTIGQLIELDAKWAVLHQTTNNSSPVAITLYGGLGVHPYGYGLYNSFGDRMSYIAEASFSRKFTSGFSLVVSPVYVSNNTAYPQVTGADKNFLSIAAAGRLKVTKHMSILVDYEHPFSDFRTGDHGFYDPLGFGLEEETGGHVFTLNFSNSNSISQINNLSNTQQSWTKGQYRFGFTISRMFDLRPKQKGETEKY
ncbi:hypothetical protein BEL04_23340 [Mucilaginibacter sp. PPCGB 2223]|uniref:DUF5777 family beta-barrel protein n=1 Tax=Mucilaginibacter sp. PPCGB 2223 TaxID=1886027 RepID=UPI000826D463|nr:DUF5777 family beta-barrel protein [Mucilaginibacter sp. PPCGB 2223]OCX50247.1 hypothetical protein BEL04_23340 [Mucilaginibacter sp. PPCGB 2223]